MISRVAESCFWLQRHMERIDNTARMVDVNSAFILDTHLNVRDAWMPLLVAVGEAPRFSEMHGDVAEDGELVQHYLTWERKNPVSIHSSAYWARENARTIRETISLETWECLNEFWLWLDRSRGRRSYENDRARFFREIKHAIQLFRGVSMDTMLHDEPFEFMQLGMHVERAGMVARMLDVKLELLAMHEGVGREAHDFSQWLAILRSCSAVEAFLKCNTVFRGSTIANFLVGNAAFPRSIKHCLDRALEVLCRIRDVPGLPNAIPGAGCAESLERLRQFVLDSLTKKNDPVAMHEALTHVIDTLTAICDDLHESFFAAQMPAKLDESSVCPVE